MDDRLEEFASALARYGRLSGVELDMETAKAVEGLQLRLMDDVRGKIRSGESLDELLDELAESGDLDRLLEEAARALGDEPEGGWEAALEAGEADVPGARSALIAIQAVARAYAEAREGWGGDEGGGEGGARCPLCGTESGTMFREGSSYRMVCPLCGHTWRVSEGAIACPFCGERNKVGLFTDREGYVGLAHCQGCGSTWHVVLRELDVPRILLPLIAMGAERFRPLLPGTGKG